MDKKTFHIWIDVEQEKVLKFMNLMLKALLFSIWWSSHKAFYFYIFFCSFHETKLVKYFSLSTVLLFIIPFWYSFLRVVSLGSSFLQSNFSYSVTWLKALWKSVGFSIFIPPSHVFLFTYISGWLFLLSL